MSAVIGTLTVIINESGADVEIASILNFNLSHNVEMLPRLHEDVYGWRAYQPGNKRWNGNGQYLHMLDTGSTVDYLDTLRTAFMNKTQLTFKFEYPTGERYQALGFISGFQIGQAEAAGYSGSFSVIGISNLTLIELGYLYMYLYDPDTDYQGTGIYRNSVALGEMEKIESFTGTNHIRYMAFLDSEQKIIYTKEGLEDNVYEYDLNTQTETLFAVVTERDNGFLKILNDPVNSHLLISVDRAALLRSQIQVFDYAGTKLTTHIPDLYNFSGTESDVIGINYARGRVYGEVNAYEEIQSWDYNGFLEEGLPHYHNGDTAVGGWSAYSETHNAIFLKGNAQILRITPSDSQSTTAHVNIHSTNTTNIKQIIWDPVGSRLYLAIAAANLSKRMDSLGTNVQDFTDGSGVSCTSVCISNPN